MPVTLELKLRVKYDESPDLTTDQLKSSLSQNLCHAVGRGLLTTGTDSTVDDWSYKIEEIQP